ncbi:PREDICTED: putative F-box/kelch-repeat protein At5g03000 [Camelina sativa]|uniref:F-box/kelch-repeat protein At5g03000 n=1 Tax=Camelina sativa TaxID=90675 RepID=A0ABM1QFG4_CAMSA|nr:PREDICTED: putative F-box/kelch-repeat protein At5g03000 [Camelina sativa]
MDSRGSVGIVNHRLNPTRRRSFSKRMMKSKECVSIEEEESRSVEGGQKKKEEEGHWASSETSPITYVGLVVFGVKPLLVSSLTNKPNLRDRESKTSNLRETTKEMKKTSSPTSFSSLPEEIVFHCLARVPRYCRPTLCLVSKYFRSLIASPELEATRSRNGITEDYLYVCLDLNKKNPNPSWFKVSRIPKQQKLKPVPSFPHQLPKSSSVVSIGSEIYIIGGLVNGHKSNRVLSFDGRSRQWRILPNMRLPREAAAADVIDGKIYVIGGSSLDNIEGWGEVYDPKTQTWEPLLPTTLNLTAQMNVVPGKLVMGGKVYARDGLKLNLDTKICLVDNGLRLMSISHHNLFWNDPKQDSIWRCVEGLEELSDYTKECKTEVWCAEVLFERRGLKELWGSVEWTKKVFTFEGCDPRTGFFLRLSHIDVRVFRIIDGLREQLEFGVRYSMHSPY